MNEVKESAVLKEEFAGHNTDVSANSSFNTADSFTSFIHAMPSAPPQSVFPGITSTPRRTPNSGPLLTDDVLDSASSRVRTLPPNFPFYQDCPRLLRSNTMAQRHATAQHVLNQQLPGQLKNELGLESPPTAESSRLSGNTTASPPVTESTSRPTRRKLTWRAVGKRKGPKTGRK